MNLPIFVRAVLLPFKGQIVYDSLLQPYSMHFGSNIRANLRETYLRAKQRGEIITRFDGSRPAPEQTTVVLQDWRPQIETLLQGAAQLRGGAGQPAIHGPAFNLVQASLQLALAGVTEPDDADRLEKELRNVRRALGKVESTIRRM